MQTNTAKMSTRSSHSPRATTLQVDSILRRLRMSLRARVCVIDGLISYRSIPDEDGYMGRPGSIHSTTTTRTERDWRRRQTIKRGVTRKVKLTKGNLIVDYPVPTAVFSAIEGQYSNTKTNEFSYVPVIAARG